MNTDLKILEVDENLVQRVVDSIDENTPIITCIDSYDDSSYATYHSDDPTYYEEFPPEPISTPRQWGEKKRKT